MKITENRMIYGVFLALFISVCVALFITYRGFSVETTSDKVWNYDGMELYTLNQYDNNEKLIHTYPSVFIISENEDFTLIHDTYTHSNIRVWGNLEFVEH